MTDKMNYLNIYYRSHSAEQDKTGAIVLDSSPGHPYVGLQGKGNGEQFFGFYKPDGIPIGKGKVLSEQEKIMHSRVLSLSEKDNQNYIFAKQIILTTEQYNRAITFAKNAADKDNVYIFGLSDCVDFTQSVYNAAGLPLHFTQIYSSEELSKLPNLASYKMSLKYDIREPGLINVKGLTKDQVASELNIPADRLKPVVNTGLDADMDMRQTFQLNLNESDFLPQNLVKTFTPSQMKSYSTEVQDNHQSTMAQDHPSILQRIITLGNGKSANFVENFQEFGKVQQKICDLMYGKDDAILIKTKLSPFQQELLSMISEAEQKNNQSGNIDIDSLMHNIIIKTSLFLESLK